MRLVLSVEGQSCTEIGLSGLLAAMQSKLKFLSNPDISNEQKYGTEFDSITIIPTCVDDRIWHALGWKERILIRRKAREADIRLRIDYDQFVNSDEDGKREIFINVLIESIKAIQIRSKGDFNGDALIEDVMMAVESCPIK